VWRGAIHVILKRDMHPCAYETKKMLPYVNVKRVPFGYGVHLTKGINLDRDTVNESGTIRVTDHWNSELHLKIAQ